MSVFCYMRDARHLLLGIPSALEWSIEATPTEGGSVLTLYVDGAKEVHLLGGKPVNLSKLLIEVKDFSKACPDTIGPAECVNISKLSDNTSYFEVVRGDAADHNQSEDKSTADLEEVQTCYVDRTAFYKWSKVLSYLEDRLGVVTVASWFDDAVITEFTDERVTLDTASEFRCEVIKRRCLNYIQDALKEIWNSNATVNVVVDRN